MTKRRRYAGSNFTAPMESDRINCAHVNQSPDAECFLPPHETKQMELEGVVYIFYFLFVVTSVTDLAA